MLINNNILPRPDYKNKLLKIGFNKDVVSYLLQVYEESKKQCCKLVGQLVGLSYRDQIYSIWNYFIENVVYQEDQGNDQCLKTPARLLAEGVGDCKSYSLFFASCLHCLNIPFVFRFVSFDNATDFQHVYIVACPYTSQQIILDAVEKDKFGVPIFNYARDFLFNKDIAG